MTSITTVKCIDLCDLRNPKLRLQIGQQQFPRWLCIFLVVPYIYIYIYDITAHAMSALSMAAHSHHDPWFKKEQISNHTLAPSTILKPLVLSLMSLILCPPSA